MRPAFGPARAGTGRPPPRPPAARPTALTSGKVSTPTLTGVGYTGEYRSYPLNAQLTTVYARRPLDFSVLRFAVIFALALAVFAPVPGQCRGRTPT